MGNGYTYLATQDPYESGTTGRDISKWTTWFNSANHTSHNKMYKEFLHKF